MASTITRLHTVLPMISKRAEIRRILAEKQLTSKLVSLEAEQEQVGTDGRRT